LLFWMDQKRRKDLRPNVGKQRLENGRYTHPA
jgi:hypothetical protein